MADPEHIRFSNEEIRPLADRVAQLYYRSKVVLDAWNSRGFEIAFAKSAEVLADGSESDGRPKITCDDVHSVIKVLSEFVADCEALDKSKLSAILRVSVNPR